MVQMENYTLPQRLVRNLTYALTSLCLRPKLYFVNENARRTAMSEPAILISNHTFALNGAVVATLFKGENIRFLLAKDMIKTKLLARYFNTIGCIPIDRNEADTSWLHRSVDTIKNGGKICLFPEGKVSFTDEVGEFKPGFLLLAAASGAPIVPMCVVGKRRFFTNRQVLMVGEPIAFERPQGAMSAQYLKEKAAEYRDSVLALKEETLRREKESKRFGKLFLQYADRKGEGAAALPADGERAACKD